jgi:hypothetical protein
MQSTPISAQLAHLGWVWENEQENETKRANKEEKYARQDDAR